MEGPASWFMTSQSGQLYSSGPMSAPQTVKDPENYVVMYFTGLHDKNGKEIYEGDRIMISANDFSHAFPETIDDIFKAYQLVGRPETHWEVIGDIYNNPELLT
jgi:hypothetical protein